MSENKDVSGVLNRIFLGETLTRSEANEVMGYLMDGAMSQIQAAALLSALRTRGETVEEITGFAEAMRLRSVKVSFNYDGVLLDTCSTGGTGINTINIGTTSMFVIAAADVKIAKHGNRAVTRRSSSADTLEALGIKLEQTSKQLSAALENVGIAFLFARSHHPAMKFVAPIRAELRARTVFNILGPLTNPAGANRQVLGVFSPTFVKPLAGVLNALGTERALVVHGDGMDDLTVSGETYITEVVNGKLKSYTLTPEEVGLQRYNRADVLGGDGKENAQTLREILAGRVQGAKRDVVLLNAGAGLYVSDKAGSIKEGVEIARDLIDKGAALRKLEEYLEFNPS
ncbi:MAG: anthranilate phosphoribosyltransferase [Trueperaceae bacterium]